MAFVRPPVELASVAAPIIAQILLLALRSAAVVAVFSPVSRFSRWFDFCYFFGILAFIPGLHFWCCLSCSACLFFSSLSPKVASLGCFFLQATFSGGHCLSVWDFSFFHSGAVSSSPPPAGGGVGSYWASFGVSAQLFHGEPAFFRFVSCSWGSTPSWLRLATLLLRWWFSVWLGVS